MAEKEKKRTKREQIRLDHIMRTLFRLSKRTVVRLINGLFHESFRVEEVKLRYANSRFITDRLDTVEGDAFLTVEVSGAKKEFHVEFQTLNDSAMAVRMFEYGFRHALEHYRSSSAAQTETIDLFFPRQLVIFLEENERIGETVELKLHFPDGQTVVYQAPTLRYWNYTGEELVRQQLYALIPLQVFRIRKRLQHIARSGLADEEKRQRMLAEFNVLKAIISRTLEQLEGLYNDDELDTGDFERLLLVLQNITDYLYNHYDIYQIRVDKEVRQMLEPWFDFPKLKREARQKGKMEGKIEGQMEGKIEGKLEVAKKLLETGKLTLPEIAEVADLSMEQIAQLQQNRQDQPPV